MKTFAVACKILAGILWIAIAVFKISADITSLFSSVPPRDGAMLGWGTPTYYYWVSFEVVLLLVVAFLAVAPNRWLVSSRAAFGVSLLIVLFAFSVVVVYDWKSHPSISVRDFLAPIALANAALTFGPLPISLALSFWRQQRGEKVSYA